MKGQLLLDEHGHRLLGDAADVVEHLDVDVALFAPRRAPGLQPRHALAGVCAHVRPNPSRTLRTIQ